MIFCDECEMGALDIDIEQSGDDEDTAYRVFRCKVCGFEKFF